MVSKTRGFRTASRKVPIVSRTLSGTFFVAAFSRPKKRKRTNQEIVENQEIPNKKGKVRKRKRTNLDRRVPIGNPPRPLSNSLEASGGSFSHRLRCLHRLSELLEVTADLLKLAAGKLCHHLDTALAWPCLQILTAKQAILGGQILYAPTPHSSKYPPRRGGRITEGGV